MFCQNCGTEVQPGLKFCRGCSRPLNDYAMVAQASRMQRHLQLLGIFWIAYSAITILGGVVVVIIRQRSVWPCRAFRGPGISSAVAYRGRCLPDRKIGAWDCGRLGTASARVMGAHPHSGPWLYCSHSYPVGDGSGHLYDVGFACARR